MPLSNIFVIPMLISICLGYSLKTKDSKFDESILAVGVPFYKLLMSLGNCNKTLLFEEEKAWGRIKYNRVLDIYYKSANPDWTVSRVEIEIVIDNTDCSVYSKNGLGGSEFSATMFIPTRVSMIFYHLKIFTCTELRREETPRPYEIINNSEENYEEANINKLPIYDRPIRPDVGPDHIYYGSTPVMYVHPHPFDEFENKLSADSKSTTPLPINIVPLHIDG